MRDNTNTETLLVSDHIRDLTDLFADWTFVDVADEGGRHYPAPDGYYLLCGLPGSLRRNCALFVRPHDAVRQAAESRLANGVIGAFRSVRSARYMKDGLLPVYVTDPQRIASPLLALVSYGEHDRFENGSSRDIHGNSVQPSVPQSAIHPNGD
jgi:hypothetical protein